MKRWRRLAGLCAALFLGVAAWLGVMLCWPTEGELRLARELSTGRVVARAPEPRNPFFEVVVYGRASLTSRFIQPGKNLSGMLPPGTVSEISSGKGEQVWAVKLDPLDKSWELEVKESRAVYLKMGGMQWRIGTKTRMWRTKRVSRRGEDEVASGHG